MSTVSNTRLIISILQQIPRHPDTISVNELREKLLSSEGIDIPIRNMQRYLSQVKGHFGLDCVDAESGNAKLWFVENVERRSANRGFMPTTQAVSYVVVQKILENIAPKPILKSLEPAFKQAQVSLSSGANVSIDWTKKIRVIQEGLPVIKKSATQEIIDTALECVLCETQVDIVYQPEKNVHPKKYRVSPLGIVVKGAKQYLVCIDERSGSETPRHFLFNHILECDDTQVDIDRKRFVGSHGFDLEEYCKNNKLEAFENSETITLIAEVQPQAWKMLLDNPISEDQKLDTKTDGDKENRILSAKVLNSPELKRWILSLSSDITILEPQSLRNSIQESCHRTADNYQKPMTSEQKKVS